MRLKDEPEVVLAAFRALGNQPSRDEIQSFVTKYFDKPGTEFETWNPADWKSSISLFNLIKDPNLKEFGKELHKLWEQLGRKIKEDVKNHPQRYSLLYSSNPFIVPGGRFREFYYWDSYWVIQGLLVSEMYTTAKGMLQNFLQIIERFGFVPNGARVYYTRRSQPPFLIPMINKYYEATSDVQFLRDSISGLEYEYNFWMANRTVDVAKEGKSYTLNQYAVDMQMPRPESYREDVETSNQTKTGNKTETFSNLASAAESGFDFSSRWLSQEGDDKYKLHTIKTKSIVPVDLNSILCLNEKLLAKFYGILGNSDKEALYTNRSKIRTEALNSVFWDEERGYYFDWDLQKQAGVTQFSQAGIVPIYAGCHGVDTVTKTNTVLGVLSYLEAKKILNFQAGVPTSLVNTSQQWDFPNAWAPLQDMLIYGLRNSDVNKAKTHAKNLAEKWLITNYRAWKESGYMFEKYNVNVQGAAGRGGEYNVQVGFGWTNGVALKLLRDYGEVITISTNGGTLLHTTTPYLSILLLLFLLN